MRKSSGTRLPERRPMRLTDYDYTTPGGYFITICTHGRLCHLGEIHNGQMCLSAAGQIVETCWHDLPAHYPSLVLDSFVVMPNHVHALLFIEEQSFPSRGLPEIIRAFKSFSARDINKAYRFQESRFWQRGYFDRIVHQETALTTIREYIMNNPIRWQIDRNNPANFNRRRAGLRPAPTGFSECKIPRKPDGEARTNGPILKR